MEQQNSLFGVKLKEKEVGIKDITSEIYEHADDEFKEKHNIKKRQKIIDTHLDKVKKHNQRIKKKTKRKGKITISYSYASVDFDGGIKKGDRFTSVDFDGFQEGSGSPCNDDEADEYLQKLYLEKSKDYKIEIIDKRAEQQKGFDKLKDVKTIIKIDNHYQNSGDYSTKLTDKKPEPAFCLWFDRVDSCLGAIDSSAMKERIKREGLEKTKQDVLDEEIQDMLNAGYQRKNIEIKIIPLDENAMRKWESRHNEDIRNAKISAEKEIKELSKKLKEQLEIKYGYPVKIIVEKGG